MGAPTKVSGNTVSRKDWTISCTWKQPSWKNQYRGKIGPNKYLFYKRNSADGSFGKVDVDGSKKSYSYNISASSFYPYTKKMISSVGFAIKAGYVDFRQVRRGKRWVLEQYIAYSEATYGSYPIKVPNAPALSVAYGTGTSTFTWDAPGNSENQIFIDIEYQSCLTQNGAAPSWPSASSRSFSASGSVAYTDNLDETKSYTRWFRARSRGPAGPSAWVTTSRVYAKPYAAVVESKSGAIRPAIGTDVTLSWTQKSDSAHPVEKILPEYIMSKLPTPPASGWAPLGEDRQPSSTQYSGLIPDVPDEDESLWVHVKTTWHDKNNISAPKKVLSAKLKDPEITDIDQDSSNYKATISVENNSDCSGVKIVVYYRPASGGELKLGEKAVDPQGSDDITVQCPNWSGETSIQFGVQAVTADMASDKIWSEGVVPTPPSNVVATASDAAGVVDVTWDWSWAGATKAVVSWSDYADAWDSNKAPETYDVSALHGGSLKVVDLEPGKTWYFRVKLVAMSDEAEIETAWSEITTASTVDLASAPAIPSLMIEPSTITMEDIATAFWSYVTTDGTLQSYAEIAEATVSQGVVTVGSEIAHADSAQHIDLDPVSLGWSAGETHALVVRVRSTSGRESNDWSLPAYVTIADPVVASITSTSLESEDIPTDIQDVTRTVLSLKAMPLTVTVTGAGHGGKTTLMVERASDYHMERPDGIDTNGFEGELIASVSQIGEAAITIGIDDLIGVFDDEAKYRLVAMVTDSAGQTAKDTLDFEVHWTHQAIMPEASAEMLDDVAVKIKPIEPTGAVEGDTCDIYRLSADRPVLIVENAEFGTEYVDPYPAIGIQGGHRIVYKTINGDYITEDNKPAWIDLGAEDGDFLDCDSTIISYGDETIYLAYNLTFSNSWSKDFRETRYLGGSVKGDWNPGIERKASVNGDMITLTDANEIQSMRELADYPGICHIRTPDGSSFCADIQVSEDRSHKNGGNIASFKLSATRVDPETRDGMLYADWVIEDESE